MCILFKLNYAKFGVSNFFFSKVMEEKPLGVGSTPLPWDRKVKKLNLTKKPVGLLVNL